MTDDDESRFWHDAPQAWSRRRRNHPSTRSQVRPGSRSHDYTQQIPVIRVARSSAPRWRRVGGQHNPLLARVALMLGAFAVAAPLAWALRDTPPGAEAGAGEAPVLLEVDSAEVTGAATEADPSTSAGAAGSTGAVTVTAQPPGAVTAAPETASSPSVAAEAPAAPEATQAAMAIASPAQVDSTAAVKRELVKPVCVKTYTVVAGDYWIRIAGNWSVTLVELLAANNATVETSLYPGGDICLPAHATPAPTTTTTVAPTTTAATTTTTVKPTSYTREQVVQIIRDVWPDELEEEAIRIATQSNLIPTAKNFCCYGLFQIYFNVHKSWLAGIGVTSATQLFDPLVNAKAAYKLYQLAGGWGPWAL